MLSLCKLDGVADGTRQGFYRVVGCVLGANRCVWSGSESVGVKEVFMFSIGVVSVLSTAMITLRICVAADG